MRKAYTLIELLITMTITALMAIFGIAAFQNYGKTTVFEQKASEIEGLINQVEILAKNPSQSAKSYCLKISSDRFSLYRGLDQECKERALEREVLLSKNEAVVDETANVAYRFLICDLLGNDCYLKQADENFNKISIDKKTFFFKLEDSNGRKSNFYLSVNPFNLEVSEQ